MNVTPTEIKGELFQLAEGKKSEAKIQICRYLHHMGIITVRLQNLPSRSTSEFSLDSEMILYLTSLNELRVLKVQDDSSLNSAVKVTQDIDPQPRRLSFLASLCSKFKRSIWCHGRGQQIPDIHLEEKLEMSSDYENYTDSCGSDSPSSIQTVIQNEDLVMLTPPVFPIEPKSTTNIFKLM